MNQPPDYCPYCGTAVESVDPAAEGFAESFAPGVETPMVYRCEDCEDNVFYNPTPGASVAVVDGDAVLLVEDFRTPGEWKLPSGRVELGESIREAAARELREETGLAVDPGALVYWYDEAGEPVPEQYMANVDYAVPHSETEGTLAAASDTTDARFFTPEGFADADYTITETHVDRFGTDSLRWVLERARAAIDE